MPIKTPHFKFDDFQHSLQDTSNIHFTNRASRDIRNLGFNHTDALDTLKKIKAINFIETKYPNSAEGEHDIADVYKVTREKIKLYIKITMKNKTVIISFHKDKQQ